MRMNDFIAKHREEIDQVINSVLYRWDGNGHPGRIPNPPPKRSDSERKEWIIGGDEGLYRWARREGVKI